MAAGIYVHIPFCLRKCPYCDFYSVPKDDRTLRREYTEALMKEAAFYGARYGKDLIVDSIFFGGGTPSLMEPQYMEAIIRSLFKHFNVTENCEITMECNPATMNAQKAEGYRKAGVNRISIGAQSFDDDVLKGLGRLHNAADIRKTFAAARDKGFDNISLDLMFAVPGLTAAIWKDTVKKAVEMKPDHLSFYSLEIAEDTEFYRMMKDGMISETSQATDRRMYASCLEIISDAGFRHYEISNGARFGKECMHNLKYWSFDEYIGLGASAHSFIGGVRFSNIASVKYYMQTMEKQDIAKGRHIGQTPVEAAGCVDSFHINSRQDNYSEYVFTALRTDRGVVFEDFTRKTKGEFWDVFSQVKDGFEKYVDNGYAVSDTHHIGLTVKGIDISNKIMALFV